MQKNLTGNTHQQKQQPHAAARSCQEVAGSVRPSPGFWQQGVTGTVMHSCQEVKGGVRNSPGFWQQAVTGTVTHPTH